MISFITLNTFQKWNIIHLILFSKKFFKNKHLNTIYLNWVFLIGNKIFEYILIIYYNVNGFVSVMNNKLEPMSKYNIIIL